jgi:hypothetical protein
VSIDGFHPRSGEKFENNFVFPDVDDAVNATPAQAFANEVCNSKLIVPSPYVLKISGSTPGLSLKDQNAATGSAVVTDTTSPIVTTCSLKVIATAVNVCAYKTLDRAAYAQFTNNSLFGLLGVAGAAAGIAALAGSTGQTTALVAAGATVASSVATNSQKAISVPASVVTSSIVNAGLTYLMVDNTIMLKNGTLATSGKPAVAPVPAVPSTANSPYIAAVPGVPAVPAAPETPGYLSPIEMAQDANSQLRSYGELFNASISVCVQAAT